MATHEKLPLTQPSAPSAPGATRSKCRGRRVPLLALALGTMALLWLHAPISILPGRKPAQPVAFEAQCPQVEPLRPKGSDALARMDAYLESSQFRNETIVRMAGAIQVPSESFDDLGPVGEDPRWDIMYDMAAYLDKTFPLVHKTLKLDKVNTHGLLYTWEGSDKSLKPTVLMAHQDVVPVAAATVKQWTHPPFSGHYDGKSVWGRGASDCKNLLVGTLEAVELLIEAQFKPKRTLVLAFGFDEEISGAEGAGHLAPAILDRYGKDGVAVIVDEGNGVGASWGANFAMPAVAEKGYVDVEVIVRMPGGHSSIPPPHNGIGVMSELITLVEANRYEPHFHPENPFLGLLQCGAAHAPEFPPEWKKLLATPGAQHKLAQQVAQSSDALKYLFTTSVAVDVINGGVKSNALPERTTATINHRVNVGDHPSDVQERLTKLASTIAAKYNLTLHAFDDAEETASSLNLKAIKPLEPAPVTPTNVDSVTPYAIISGTTRALYNEEIFMAPSLSTGNTDT